MERFVHMVCGILFSCVWLASVGVNGGTWNDTARLVSDLLKTYDVNIRPVRNQSEPVVIYATFNFKTIQDFDEVAGKLTISGYMYISWFDEFLTWNSSFYDTNFLTFPRKNVWYPTLVLANSYSKLEDVGADWLTVHVASNGLAVYVPGFIYTVSCTADVTQYPFDQQFCSLVFVPWGYNSDGIRLQLQSTEVLTTYFSDNGEWTYVNATGFQFPGVKEHSPDVIGFTILMRRRSVYLIMNVILPVVFISLINILVFVLPVESGERVSFSLTVMLSLAIFMTIVEDNLPKSSDPIPKLSFYLIFSLISSVMICLFNVLSLWMFFKQEDRKVSIFCKRLVKMACIRGSGNVQREAGGRPCRLQNDKPKILLHKKINIERKTGGPFKEDANVTDNAWQNDVTWIDVSAAIDRLSTIFYVIAFVVNNAFLVSIAFNNSM